MSTTTTEKQLEVANEIRRQLGPVALRMVGASNLYALENGLQFDIKGSKQANRIQITLTPADLYDVRALKMGGPKTGFEIKKDETESGIYADDLRRILESMTGLYWTM
jgi:hypothetical protein